MSAVFLFFQRLILNFLNVKYGIDSPVSCFWQFYKQLLKSSNVLVSPFSTAFLCSVTQEPYTLKQKTLSKSSVSIRLTLKKLKTILTKIRGVFSHFVRAQRADSFLCRFMTNSQKFCTKFVRRTKLFFLIKFSQIFIAKLLTM